MPFIKYVDIGGYDWGDDDVKLVHSTFFDKTASKCHTPETLLNIIADIEEDPNGVYVLINALGANEAWGVNLNGDAFPEWGLKGLPAPPEAAKLIEATYPKRIPNWTTPSPDTYGHETFVSNANPFIFHQNKDPKKATGKVIASAYNDKMHRVELILFLDDRKDPDGVRALRNGDPVPFSMGARVAADSCSICGNVARNRTQYCDHLRTQMKRILPNGQQVFAYNFYPKFFDISRVRVPADPSAWALRKVASTGILLPPTYIDDATELKKLSETAKAAEIKKNIPAYDSKALASGDSAGKSDLVRIIRDHVMQDQASGPDVLPDPQLELLLKREGLGCTLGAAGLGGILLKPRELKRAVDVSGEEVPSSLELDKIPRTLMSMVRAIMPRRSLLAIHLKSRKLASAKVVDNEVNSEQYQRYLRLMRKTASELVQVSKRPEVLVELDPDWIGRAMFKSASASVTDEDWVPFFAAVAAF